MANSNDGKRGFTEAFEAAAKDSSGVVKNAALGDLNIVAAFRAQAKAGVMEPHKPSVFDRIASAVKESGRSGATVIDVGCGIGTDTAAIAKVCGEGVSVIGVDLLVALVAAAKEDHPELEFREGDMAALPFADGTVDVVFCSRLLFHAKDLHAVLDQFLRVLRPGGRMFALEGDMRYTGIIADDEKVAAAHAEIQKATVAHAAQPDAGGKVFKIAKNHPQAAAAAIRAHTAAYDDYSKLDAGLQIATKMAKARLSEEDAELYIEALKRAPQTGEVVVPLTMWEVEMQKKSA